MKSSLRILGDSYHLDGFFRLIFVVWKAIRSGTISKSFAIIVHPKENTFDVAEISPQLRVELLEDDQIAGLFPDLDNHRNAIEDRWVYNFVLGSLTEYYRRMDMIDQITTERFNDHFTEVLRKVNNHLFAKKDIDGNYSDIEAIISSDAARLFQRQT